MLEPITKDLKSQAELEIKWVQSGTEAGRVSDFLLGEHCFDDQRFTPGEIEQLRWLPVRSLQENHVNCWYTEEQGKVISAIIFVENEHHSGGYRLEYFGVHRSYRHQKLAWHLLEAMFQYCRSNNGRYVETFTCDLPEYASARKLFERNGFTYMCRLPDYYYEGEGKLLYLKMLKDQAFQVSARP
ncbi:GNAT family N-acetyltransferase [Ammoniphilus resinae]|uniref:Ribosomal protein S18 acetylase RimI-like enzyme n=1 Tax=Ammoniphilus resinae TaxID=861532 RepID=A0ABS4GPQ4_9BACL|nr:GNAT family N-acetyltransferase [Ammoniphilus resinae]MBP1932254.1 ribosomal protein S18 acetylase RimI-like enzyme [Ammoniphilus resinae]